MDDWKCTECKCSPRELHSFGAFGNNANRNTEGEFCDKCFNKLWKEGEVEVIKED